MEWCMIRWPGCGRRQKEFVFTAGRDDQIGPAIKGLRRFLAAPAVGLWLLDESDAFVVEPARDELVSPHRGGCQTLGTAVFSGMIGVTLFGLILTPVFYVITRRARPASAPTAERAGARAEPRASPAE
jgi:hypothetical protein